jgi:protein SCO1/2
MKKRDNTYIGISFVILVFGIIFVPRIVERLSSGDILRDESRSQTINYNPNANDLLYLEINGERKKVPNFSFTNQNGKVITNENYSGMVYVVEFFFTTCPTICPVMNYNLIEIQNSFKNFNDLGFASFTINPSFDTVEVLKDYADQYGVTNKSWNLMTGDKDEIYDLANLGFNLYTSENINAAGGFEHSGNFALIDKEGYIRSRSDDFGNPIIYYKGYVDHKKEFENNGDNQEISILKEDILQLLKE